MSMPKGTTKGTIQEEIHARALYEAGFNIYEIGQELERSPSTIGKWLRTHTKMRPRGNNKNQRVHRVEIFRGPNGKLIIYVNDLRVAGKRESNEIVCLAQFTVSHTDIIKALRRNR